MDIYLHHYPASLFSEKIRLLLGYLGANWHSVETSSIMPRPLLMPLTGGYRKTPNLQIGANVYCDTTAIAYGLARHFNNGQLHDAGFCALRTAEWADTHLFRVTVALNFRPEAIGAFMSQLSSEEMVAFQQDRAELTGDAPIASMSTDAAMAYLHAYLRQAEQSLTQKFLGGNEPSIADFAVYHCLWFLQNNDVNRPLLEPYQQVMNWLKRMAAFGHGQITESSGEQALAQANGCAPQLDHSLQEAHAAYSTIVPTALRFRQGDLVSVTPADYGRVPVTGELVVYTPNEVVIKRHTAETGEIYTHFPNVGFEVQLLTKSA